jgi:hypothetical protein
MDMFILIQVFYMYDKKSQYIGKKPGTYKSVPDEEIGRTAGK